MLPKHIDEILFNILNINPGVKKMSFLGEILGYDNYGHYLMGKNKDNKINCISCGISSYIHTD